MPRTNNVARDRAASRQHTANTANRGDLPANHPRPVVEVVGAAGAEEDREAIGPRSAHQRYDHLLIQAIHAWPVEVPRPDWLPILERVSNEEEAEAVELRFGRGRAMQAGF